MIKIGWGTRIAILYCGFVLLMGIMVAICMRQKTDLVSEDYYEKELAFQSRIAEAGNANALPEKVTHTITAQGIGLSFPSFFNNKNVTGEVLFFRPSDASKDYKTAIRLNEHQRQEIPLDNLSKGMYRMQISWEANDTAYFNEQTIVIP